MKLFCFDIDDTLLDKDKVFRKATIAAIRKKQNEGNAVCIASGRPFSGIAPYLAPLSKTNLFVVGFNGAALYECYGSLLYQNGMPFSVFLSFYKEHSKLLSEGVSMYCYTGNEVCSFEDSEAIHYENRMNNAPMRILSDRPLDDNAPIMKFMVASDIHEKVDAVEKEKGSYSFLHTVRSAPCFFEFTKLGVDKSSAIEVLRLHLGIENKLDVVTFGDAGNDYLMLKDYYGVAMGNATESCKEVAKKVTKTCKEDGVAYALEHYF